MIGRSRVPDPNGSGRRVEALTVGVWPLLGGLGAGTVLILSFIFVMWQDVRDLQHNVGGLVSDRFSRSMMIEVCLRAERINADFECPDIPVYRPAPPVGEL